MPVQQDDVVMPNLTCRDDYIDYFEAESAGAEPTGARLRKNLVKSYVIETVRDGVDQPNAAATFARAAGLQLGELDDGALFVLHDTDGVVAVIEGADSRFPVIHSTRKTTTIDKLVERTVMSLPWLDHVWLPGRFFDALWEWTRQTADPDRLAKLKFSYRARFERLDQTALDVEEGDEYDVDAAPEDDDQPAGDQRPALPEPVGGSLDRGVPVRGVALRSHRSDGMTDSSGDPLFHLNRIRPGAAGGARRPSVPCWGVQICGVWNTPPMSCGSWSK